MVISNEFWKQKYLKEKMEPLALKYWAKIEVGKHVLHPISQTSYRISCNGHMLFKCYEMCLKLGFYCQSTGHFTKDIFEFVFNTALVSGSSMGKALSKILVTNWLFILKWHSVNEFPNEQDVRGLIPGRTFFLFALPFLSFPFFLSFFLPGEGGGGCYCTFVLFVYTSYIFYLYIFFSPLASFLLFAINPCYTRLCDVRFCSFFWDCVNC